MDATTGLARHGDEIRHIRNQAASAKPAVALPTFAAMTLSIARPRR